MPPLVLLEGGCIEHVPLLGAHSYTLTYAFHKVFNIFAHFYVDFFNFITEFEDFVTQL